MEIMSTGLTWKAVISGALVTAALIAGPAVTAFASPSAEASSPSPTTTTSVDGAASKAKPTKGTPGPATTLIGVGGLTGTQIGGTPTSPPTNKDAA